MHCGDINLKKSNIVAAALALPLMSATLTLGKADNLIATNLRDYEETLFTDAVRRTLKDPYSAVFSNVIAFRDKNSRAIHVCGLVNAKNSFGGYVGNRIFYGLSAYGKDNRIEPKEPFVTTNEMLAVNLAEKFCR